MKNKEFYSGTTLPLYEVTELTVEEALLALSSYRSSNTHQGIMSAEALRMDYRRDAQGRRQH